MIIIFVVAAIFDRIVILIVSIIMVIFFFLFLTIVVMMITPTGAQVLRRSQRAGGAGQVQGPVARAESPGGLPAQPQGQWARGLGFRVKDSFFSGFVGVL